MSTTENIFDVVYRQDIPALKQQVKANPKIMAEVNEEGIPALHIAVETGNLEMVKFIIEYSIVNPCLLDREGNTILHYGVKSGNLELVKYLVERVDISLDQGNLLGVTPFDLAIQLEKEAQNSGENSFLQGTGADTAGQAARTEIRICFEEVLGCTMDEMYHNPIRRGMHPDPSIVRVGEDYYMVNSSFVFFPCIPISHSRDLIHWEVIGHAITNPEWARLKDLEGGRGYWAPDISYYGGRFYITATYRLNDGGEKLRYQMVTSSDRPEGPYCEPVFLDEDGIDPSIFTDVDGRRYMLLNRGARIFEITPDGREIISEPKLLWYGHNKKASEGPHLLYKDGYYYLFMAEGGTGMGHRISVARSRTLMGVYESCPYNPILRQWDEERQLQCCGHGKPVQTPEGDWYMVYLCYRLGTSGYGFLGRETAMDPITWTADGWPIVNSLKGPSDLQKKPKTGRTVMVSGAEICADKVVEAARGKQKEQFEDKMNSCVKSAPSSGLWGAWSTMRGAHPGDFEFLGEQIVIHGNGLDLNVPGYGNLLVQPQPDFNFEVSCRLSPEHKDAWDVSRRNDTIGAKVTEAKDTGANRAWANTAEAKDTGAEGIGDWDAGLTCYYDENSYLKLGLARKQGRVGVLAAEYVDDNYVSEEFMPLKHAGEAMSVRGDSAGEEEADAECATLELRIVTEGLKRSCYYRIPECMEDAACRTACESAAQQSKGWCHVATFENTVYLSSEGLSKGKRFTGAMAGIYVHGEMTGVFGEFVLE